MDLAVTFTMPPSSGKSKATLGALDPGFQSTPVLRVYVKKTDLSLEICLPYLVNYGTEAQVGLAISAVVSCNIFVETTVPAEDVLRRERLCHCHDRTRSGQ